MIDFDITKIISLNVIIIYFILINVVTFFAMLIDKKKAQHGSWRIKEGTLFGLVLAGGGIGGIVGIYLFRHKTKKISFTIGFPTILILEVILIIVYIFNVYV